MHSFCCVCSAALATNYNNRKRIKIDVAVVIIFSFCFYCFALHMEADRTERRLNEFVVISRCLSFIILETFFKSASENVFIVDIVAFGLIQP